jgi:sulfoxide reductase heme-binding subunit YedZ
VGRRARILLKVLVWGLCLAPLAYVPYRYHLDGLGANPISFLTNHLGDWTLRLLLASLAMTPLRVLFGVTWPLNLRRLLGLFAFFYACLHFSVWLVLDHYFNWPLMLADILKRRYITVGMAALLLLVPLAATSTSGMVKRLGGTAWRRLHKVVYLIGVLAILHFLWLAKVGRTDQYAYAAVLLLLFGVRLLDAARRFLRKRRRRRSSQAPALAWDR